MGESDSFLRALLLLGLMAVIAVVEAWIPLRERPRGARRRRNVALTLIYLGMNLLMTAGVVGISLWMEQRGIGLLHWLQPPTIVAFALALVMLDFFAYVAHVLMHKAPLLWRMHRVHHSDAHVDVTTAFRQHPLEGVLRFGFTYVPAMLLGASAGATATYRALSGLNALLEHSNIRVHRRLDRALRWLIVTPDMHKIHHSRRNVETDSNYSNIFSLNDRVFGTYTPADPGTVRYGLDDSDGDESLLDLLGLRVC